MYAALRFLSFGCRHQQRLTNWSAHLKAAAIPPHPDTLITTDKVAWRGVIGCGPDAADAAAAAGDDNHFPAEFFSRHFHSACCGRRPHSARNSAAASRTARMTLSKPVQRQRLPASQ